jgi:hypothetical protein
MFTYDPFHVKLQKEGDSDILKAEVHAPFKQALLRAIKDKINENADVVFHKGNKTDEERGKYMGVVMVYEDLYDLMTKVDKKEKKGYKDKVNEITEVVKDLLK